MKRKFHRAILQLAPPSVDYSAVAGGPSTDIGAYLNRLHRSVLGSAVTEATAAATRHMEAMAAAAQAAEWESAKASLLSALGLGVASSPSAPEGALAASQRAGAGGMPSLTGASSRAPTLASAAPGSLPFGYGEGDVAPRSGLDLYAAQLGAATTGLLGGAGGGPQQGGGPIRAWGSAAEASWAEAEEASPLAGGASSGDVSPHSRMWRLLAEITREGAHGGVGARAYGGEYAARGWGAGMSPALARQWAAGGLAYTGALFRHVLEAAVEAHAEVAGVGGAPGLPGVVRGYLNVLLHRHARAALAVAASSSTGAPSDAADGCAPVPGWFEASLRAGPTVGGHPVWPQVYLCLRCGGWREALAVLQEACTADPSRVPGELVTALEAHVILMEAAEDDTARAPPGSGGAAPPSLPSTAAGDEAVGALAAPASGVPAAVARAASLFSSLRDAADAEQEREAQAAAAAGAGRRGAPSPSPVPSVDQWQLGVLSLLAGPGSDPELALPMLARSAHDFAWQRLWAALAGDLAGALASTSPALFPSVSSSGAGYVPYALRDLGGAVMDFGPPHFDPSRRAAYAYAELALLGGLPELAVAYLAAQGHTEAPSRHLHDAVHVGLALGWYGLLHSTPAQLAGEMAGEGQQGGGGSGAGAVTPAPAPSLPGLPPSGSSVTAVDDMGGLLLHVSTPSGSPSGSGSTLCLDLPALAGVYVGRVVRHNPGLAAATLALLADPPTQPSSAYSPSSSAGAVSPRTVLLGRLLASSAALTQLAGPLALSSSPDGSGFALSADLSQGALALALTGAAALAGAGGDAASTSLCGVLEHGARELGGAGRLREALSLYLRLAAAGGPYASPAVLGACADLLLEAALPLIDAPTRGQGAAASASAASGGRGTLFQTASAFLSLPAVLSAGAPSGSSSSFGATSSRFGLASAASLAASDASSLPARLRGLRLAVGCASFFDALASGGGWGDALEVARAEALMPPAPQGDGGHDAHGWHGLFDGLPAPLQQAYASAVLPALMGACVRAFGDAKRAGHGATATLRAIKAQVRGALGEPSRAAYPSTRLPADSLSTTYRSTPSLRPLSPPLPPLPQAHVLVSGHSPLMRRYVPGALLAELVAAHMGMQV